MANLRSVMLVVIVALLRPAETLSLPKLTPESAVDAQQTRRFDDSWLDRTPTNWNRRMSGLPRPISSGGVTGAQTRCREFVREPDTPAERALVRAGWLLYGAVQLYGLTKVVTAMSGVDGMCRPLGFQAFVYWEGSYAGSLSPEAMNSRTDGALTNIRLVSATRLLAEFARYKASDPLCCPSRTSHVTYRINRDDLPLVTPVNIHTGPVGTPAEEAGSDVSGDTEPLFGRRWSLTEVNGVAVRTTKPYIELDRQAKRFTGDSGCNRISGGFEIDGSYLKLSRIITTRRACLDSADQQVETDYLKGLEQTARFQVRDDTLRFSAGRAPILTFKAEATGSGGPAEEARVTGTVTYRQRMALPPGAVIEVKLLDVSRADAPALTIAEKMIRPAGRQVPIEFSLEYDPRRIDQRHSYSIQVRIIQDNRPRFISTQPYPVITGGHPNAVDVIVSPTGR